MFWNSSGSLSAIVICLCSRKQDSSFNKWKVPKLWGVDGRRSHIRRYFSYFFISYVYVAREMRNVYFYTRNRLMLSKEWPLEPRATTNDSIPCIDHGGATCAMGFVCYTVFDFLSSNDMKEWWNEYMAVIYGQIRTREDIPKFGRATTDGRVVLLVTSAAALLLFGFCFFFLRAVAMLTCLRVRPFRYPAVFDAASLPGPFINLITVRDMLITWFALRPQIKNDNRIALTDLAPKRKDRDGTDIVCGSRVLPWFGWRLDASRCVNRCPDLLRRET